MQTADAYTTDELYREVADLAREQGAVNQEGWGELVDEIVDAHLDLGELTDDEDLEGIKTALVERWHEYEIIAAAATGSVVTGGALSADDGGQPGEQA